MSHQWQGSHLLSECREEEVDSPQMEENTSEGEQQARSEEGAAFPEGWKESFSANEPIPGFSGKVPPSLLTPKGNWKDTLW